MLKKVSSSCLYTGISLFISLQYFIKMTTIGYNILILSVYIINVFFHNIWVDLQQWLNKKWFFLYIKSLSTRSDFKGSDIKSVGLLPVFFYILIVMFCIEHKRGVFTFKYFNSNSSLQFKKNPYFSLLLWKFRGVAL